MIIDNKKNYEDLNERLISFSEIKKEKLIFEPLWKDFKYSFCWSSNSIEGNTLSLEETIETLEFDAVHSNHTYKEYTDAKNLYKAIENYLCLDAKDIDETWIKQCNNMIIQRGEKYREENLYIGSMVEAVYYPPDYTLIDNKMNDWLSDINIKQKSINDVISNIAKKHIDFERIHPFPNGNGRTGRIILNQQLINNNIFPVAITDNSKYRQAFKYYDKNGDISLMEYLIISSEMRMLDKYEELLKNIDRSLNIEKPRLNPNHGKSR